MAWQDKVWTFCSEFDLKLSQWGMVGVALWCGTAFIPFCWLRRPLWFQQLVSQVFTGWFHSLQSQILWMVSDKPTLKGALVPDCADLGFPLVAELHLDGLRFPPMMMSLVFPPPHCLHQNMLFSTFSPHLDPTIQEQTEPGLIAEHKVQVPSCHWGRLLLSFLKVSQFGRSS